MTIPHNLNPESQDEIRIRSAVTAFTRAVRTAKESDPAFTDAHALHALFRFFGQLLVLAELTPQERRDLAESLQQMRRSEGVDIDPTALRAEVLDNDLANADNAHRSAP